MIEMDSLNTQADTLNVASGTISETSETLGVNWLKVKAVALEILGEYGPRLLLAIVVLIVGLWLIKVLKRGLTKGLKRRKMDITARKFIVDLIGAMLTVMLVISVLSLFGVPTTSFVAILGAAGLAIGLALQGALQNFAGGVLILFFHPYRVGHLIETGGIVGYVKDIQVFNTILVTLDNKRVIVPNGPLMNTNITNWTEEGSIRVDLSVSVAYGADLKEVRRIIIETLYTDSRILKQPEPMVGVAELADSGIKIFVRPFTKPQFYWDVHMKTLENVRNALQKEGIEIPFPQRVLTIKNNPGSINP